MTTTATTPSATATSFAAAQAFLVNAANEESFYTGFDVRTLLWEQFPFSEAAEAAFLEAFNATAEAHSFQYALSHECDKAERPFTFAESEEYFRYSDEQDAAWHKFRVLYVSEVEFHHQSFANGRAEAEEWATIKAHRTFQRKLME